MARTAHSWQWWLGVAIALASGCTEQPPTPGDPDAAPVPDAAAPLPDADRPIEDASRPPVDAAATLVGDETCNGLDDDGDGVVDDLEPRWCSTLDLARAQTGACRLGLQRCEGGEWSPCEGEVVPADEACNGVDDDCDGQADEGFDFMVDGNNCGRCGARCMRDNALTGCVEGGCVIVTCVDGYNDCNGDPTDGCEYPGECPPEIACDGEDDDGDGAIDEAFVPVGVCGQGVCAESARASSCEAGVFTPCAPGEPLGPDDTCNGRDEDCDGEFDEDFQPEACGQGQCRAGASRSGCQDGVPSACVPGDPSDEVCNGLDDDCDGSVDEQDPGGGVACETGVPGQCAIGVTRCSGARLTCLGTADPTPEMCNGLDDDCDGTTDEGDPEGGGECATGAEGPCSVGVDRCVEGRVECVARVEPVEEECNGLDDDCDGVSDEQDPGGGVPCETGQEGRCTDGATSCADAQIRCVPFNRPEAELCNGLDDDCDGQPDEGHVGLACVEGFEICEQTGVQMCAGDGPFCHHVPQQRTCASWHLDGDDQYVSVPVHEDFDLTEYTLEIRFKVWSLNPERGAFLLARGESPHPVSTTGDKMQYSLRVEPTGELHTWFEPPRASDTDINLATEARIEIGRWHHAAVSRDGEGLLTIFLDGQVAATLEATPAPASARMPFYVGARATDGLVDLEVSLDGLIEDVRVWNRALTADEVGDCALREPVIGVNGLVAWLRPEGENEHGLDLSGNGHQPVAQPGVQRVVDGMTCPADAPE